MTNASCCKSRDESCAGAAGSFPLISALANSGLQSLDSLRKAARVTEERLQESPKGNSCWSCWGIWCVCCVVWCVRFMHAYIQHVFPHRFPKASVRLCVLMFLGHVFHGPGVGACPRLKRRKCSQVGFFLLSFFSSSRQLLSCHSRREIVRFVCSGARRMNPPPPPS